VRVTALGPACNRVSQNRCDAVHDRTIFGGSPVKILYLHHMYIVVPANIIMQRPVQVQHIL